MMPLFHSLLSTIGQQFGKNRLSVLIYHQVLGSFDPMRPSEPTSETFEWQMQLLAKHYTPMSLTDAVRALKASKLPKNAVCVTFDDGYLNNLSIAQPILEKYSIPATVYVATGFSAGANMFNDRVLDFIGDESYSSFDLSAIGLGHVSVSDQQARIVLAHKILGELKYLHFEQRAGKVAEIYRDNQVDEYASRMMNEIQIKNLAEKGIEIGAHTHDHPILKTLAEHEQEQQLRHSKEALEQLIGRPVKHFAYPNGKLGDDYDKDTVALVKKVGFETATSTHWGISTKASDFFQMKRFTPWDQTPVKFHARLLLNQVRGSQ